MAKFQLIDQQIFLGKLKDTAINTPFVLTADFVGGLLNSGMPPIPDVKRTADQMVGSGAERAQKLRKGWLIPVQLPLGGLLNTETAARFGNRCLAGTRTPSAELAPGGSLAFDVVTNMQTKAQGRIPAYTTMGYDLGGYKFVFPSLAVNNFEIAFEGENDVTWSANLMGTGLYVINDTSANLVTNGFSALQAAAIALGGSTQVETGTVIGACTGSGNLAVIVTAVGMTGTPITNNVPVLNTDTAAVMGGKIRDFLNTIVNITNFFVISGTGADVILTAKVAAANDATMNINIATGTATGITAAPTSANTRAGALPALIVPPTPPEHHLMHPAGTKVTFSNGLTVDFAVDGDLISGACGLDNQVIVKQLPGDPWLVPSNRKSGAYSRDSHRGTRVPSARVKVALDATLKAFVLSQSGADITSLTYLFRGEDNIGAVGNGYFYEWEWKAPLAEIETVTSDPDGEDAAVTINFYPKTDPVTGGYWIQRIRTADSTIQ